MRPWGIAVLALSVSACAPAVPVLVVTPRAEIPELATTSSQVENAAVVTPRDGTGAIVVARERQWTGTGCTYDVALDDQHVAGLRPGEQVTLYAEPGKRAIRISARGEEHCDPSIVEFALPVIEHTTQKVRVRRTAGSALKVEVNPYGGALPE
jgi:hypothetical protein